MVTSETILKEGNIQINYLLAQRKKSSFNLVVEKIWLLFVESIPNRLFENQHNDICRHLGEKSSKGRFLGPISSKITLTRERERRTRKSEEEEMRRREKSNGCTLSFYNGYFEDRFWPKKLLDAKGPFGSKVFKNPAIYIYIPFWQKSSPFYYTGDEGRARGAFNMVSNLEALLTPYPALFSHAFYLKMHGTPLI